MSKAVIFCSTQRIPSEIFPKVIVEEVTRSLARDKAMGFVLGSKSDWKQFLNDPEVSEIVLVGVDNPDDYEVPPDGLTPMTTHINNRLIPCKFQTIKKKGILIFSDADMA